MQRWESPKYGVVQGGSGSGEEKMMSKVTRSSEMIEGEGEKNDMRSVKIGYGRRVSTFFFCSIMMPLVNLSGAFVRG